jgi:Lon-like ATP-dependent protease
MATGIYSAIHNIPVDRTVAMTGEISIHGNVKPIGGILPKIKAAKQAGAKKVIIPADNMQSILKEMEGIEIIPVRHLREVFAIALAKSGEHVIPASAPISEKESI